MMKKTITVIAIIAAMAISKQSLAQDQGQIRVGASLALGTKSAISDTGSEKMGIGINIGGDYFVIDKLSIAPSYTFFFKSSLEEDGYDISIKVSSFNIDGKYYFLTDGINVYGLFGISFASIKAETNFLGTPIEISDSETGINIGGGVDYALTDKLYLNGQLKYNTPLEQLVINLGVGFNIN